MRTNVGTLDRVIRLLLGIALIGLWFLAPAPWKWLAIAGVVLVLTAAFRICPLYAVLGLNTCRTG